MTEIVIVRHGETQLNTGGVFRGRADVALNDRGIEQAFKQSTYLDTTN